jgi:hypothetical protein
MNKPGDQRIPAKCKNHRRSVQRAQTAKCAENAGNPRAKIETVLMQINDGT